MKQKTELSLSAIVSDAVAVCKREYKKLLVYTVLYNLVSAVFSVFALTMDGGDMNGMLMMLLMILLIPFGVYFGLVLFSMLTLRIYHVLEGQETQGVNYYKLGTERFWPAFVVLLLLCLMIGIPAFIGLGTGFFGGISRGTTGPLFVVAALFLSVAVFLYVRGFMGFYHAIIQPEAKNAIKYGFAITKGKFLFVLGILILLGLVSALFNGFGYGMEEDKPSMLLGMLFLSAVINTLISPFIMSAMVALYRRLHHSYEDAHYDFVEVEEPIEEPEAAETNQTEA